MKKFGKRLLAFLLAGSLGLLSACSGSDTPAQSSSGDVPKAENTAMGRYIEEEYAWPQEVTRSAGMFRLSDGSLRVLGSIFDPGTFHPWYFYSSKDGGKSWQKEEESPLSNLDSDAFIQAATYDREGNFYFTYTVYSQEFQDILNEAMSTGEIPEDLTYPPDHHMKVAPDGTMTELSIEMDKDSMGRDAFTGYQIADNGDMVVENYGTLASYDLASGKKKNSFVPQNGVDDYLLIGGTVYIVSGNEIVLYDLESGEATGETIPMEGYSGGGALSVGEDQKSIVRADSTGIYRYLLDGSVWEQIVEGSLTSLGMPSVHIGSIFEMENGDFLVRSSGDDGYQLLHYTFSADTPAVPTEEMNVYSLSDSSTLRQAIGLYQREHPELRINFTVALDSDTAITASDAIRSLNTELLAGKGPDLLVLDSLPIDSYIEKGVLSDLSSAVSPLVQSGELLEKIANTYSRDGKLYAVPARFGVPELWGPSELIESAQDLTSFADWVVAEHERNPQARALIRMKPEQLISDFYYTCAPAWRDEDGSIKEAEFEKFLTDIKRIADAVQEIPADYPYPFDDEGTNFLWGGVYWANGLVNTVLGLSQTTEDLASPDAAATYRGDGKFAILPGQAQNVYVPQTVLGINQNSTQQENALGLIETVLSYEVQKNDFEDGYSLNIKALDESALTPYEEGDDGMQAPLYIDGEEKIFQIIWPSDETMAGIMEKIKGLSTPSTADPVLLQMILDETKDFFAGAKTAGEATAALVQRTQAYLAE